MARSSRHSVNGPKGKPTENRRGAPDAPSKQMSSKLRSKVESLLISSPAVVYSCKASGSFATTYVTPNIKAQLGYEPSDFTDNVDFWLDNIHPDDIERVQSELATLFETGRHAHEYRFKHKDGSYRWMHDQINLIRDSQGKPAEIVGYWMDVTARKQAEQDLQESEARYKTLFESSPDGILIGDVKTKKLQYANPAACTMLGHSEKEMKSYYVDDIHPKEFLDYVLSEFDAQARGDKTLVEGMPFLRKDGTMFYADVNAVKCLVDGKECNIGFFRDITDRKLAQEELAQKEFYLRSTLNNAPIMLFREDRKGITEFVAGKGLEAVGLSPEQLIGKDILDVTDDVFSLHQENRVRALKGESFTSIVIVRNRIQEIHYSPSRSIDGQITGVMGVVTDITERSKAEQGLVDKNVALREVLGRLEEQKAEMGRTILMNVDKIIMPLINVLGQGLPSEQQRYMALLKQSLEEIASPFVSRLSSRLARLTPAEIRVCIYIRRGMSNKEIAQIKHIAAATVNKHRAHIRQKLGIANKKVNLAAHLETFMQGPKKPLG